LSWYAAKRCRKLAVALGYCQRTAEWVLSGILPNDRAYLDMGSHLITDVVQCPQKLLIRFIESFWEEYWCRDTIDSETLVKESN
jgi:hypothetical protein